MTSILREPLSAGSHLLGAALSVAGLVLLMEHAAGDAGRTTALAVYGSSLILLFLASSLLHGVSCSVQTLKRLERLDYAAIFLFIAGTYTPVCLFMVKGPLGWVLLTVQWVLACIGIYSMIFKPDRCLREQVWTFLLMGWLFLFALEPLLTNLTGNQIFRLIAGSFIYTIGAVIFVLDRPHPWPGYVSAHDLWHLLVLGGTACHFFLIEEVVSRGEFLHG